MFSSINTWYFWHKVFFEGIFGADFSVRLVNTNRRKLVSCIGQKTKCAELQTIPAFADQNTQFTVQFLTRAET